MYDIENMVAIVTGGTGGIGSEIALALAEQGCRIAVLGTNEEKGRSVAADLSKKTEAAFFKCDVSKLSQIEETFQNILARFGQADILINAAGMPVREFIEDIDEEVWNRFVDTNIKSVFFFSKLLAEHITSRDSLFGRVVNISSIRAEAFDSNHAGYSISKAAINTITKCFAVSYGGDGITCNAIAPGFVQTGMTDHYMGDERASSIIETLSPICRMVERSEVAALAAYLCSKPAAAVNGQIIKIDGGGTSLVGLYH